MPKKNKKEEKESVSKKAEVAEIEDKTIRFSPVKDDKTMIFSKEPISMPKSTQNSKQETTPVKKVKHKRYISFKARFTISLVLFVILLVSSIALIMMSISKINEQTVDYKEKSKITYNVLLKDDSIYDQKYFKDNPKPKIYISSLIKNIDTTFDYYFNISESSNIVFDYNIVGNLVILNSDGSKVFYDNKIEFISNKTVKLGTDKRLNIKENLDIDYEYYNSIANNFRQNYGLNITSYLEIILTVNGKILDDKFDYDEQYVRSIKIPLAQQEVDIQVGDDNASSVHKVTVKNKLLVSNRLCITIGIIAFIIAIICLTRIINMVLKVYAPKTSRYDRFIKKILKEYDRLIVNTTTSPNITDYRIVRINSFAELLDVHDNLNLPIRYYVITEHQKSVFYVTHNTEVYVYIVKAVDLENI